MGLASLPLLSPFPLFLTSLFFLLTSYSSLLPLFHPLFIPLKKE